LDGFGIEVHVGAVGAVLSRTYGTGALLNPPCGLVTVAVGLVVTVPGVVSVHFTIPVASAGVGTQVVPGIVIVLPGVTPVQVITTAVVPLDGFGVAVHVGAGGIVTLVNKTVLSVDVEAKLSAPLIDCALAGSNDTITVLLSFV
jgi:hypothetical protein